MVTSQRILLRIQLITVVTYLVVKFMLRPYVLNQGIGGVLEVFVFSYPNFCESIVGSILLTFFFLILNKKLAKKGLIISERNIPMVAVIVAGIYVVLQEFKIHNLGGINIYDPYDVMFSILGLIVAYILIMKAKPRII